MFWAGGADQHVAWQRFQAYTMSHFGQIYMREQFEQAKRCQTHSGQEQECFL